MKKLIWGVMATFALLTVVRTAYAQGQRKSERVTFAITTKSDKWETQAKETLQKVAGVTKVEPLAKEKQVRVEYAPAKTNVQQQARALADAGTTARLLVRVEGMT